MLTFAVLLYLPENAWRYMIGLMDEPMARDQAIMLIGVVFKSTQPDESEEERRELERLVAEAAKPKKKAKKEKVTAHGPPQQGPASTAKQ